MNRFFHFACVAVLVVTGLQAAPPKRAAPVTDFWYVVSDESPAATERALVRGLVIPSRVDPTVQTTPTGSVISWQRPDGTRQSFALQGVSSFRFEPGPMKGTTYVPLITGKKLEISPGGCCACASWINAVESIERLGCVAGCSGCGCEACICSPTYPCPESPLGAMTLAAHNVPAPTMTFGKAGTSNEIKIAHRGGAAVSFHGSRLAAALNAMGETVINNPESIKLPGRVVSHESVKGDKALFAWSSPDASVILEQPRSMPAPSFNGDTIDFNSQPGDVPSAMARHLEVDPVMDRCRVCGTHPNSMSDLTIYDCVPGDSVCYRCISWECFASES